MNSTVIISLIIVFAISLIASICIYKVQRYYIKDDYQYIESQQNNYLNLLIFIPVTILFILFFDKNIIIDYNSNLNDIFISLISLFFLLTFWIHHFMYRHQFMFMDSKIGYLMSFGALLVMKLLN